MDTACKEEISEQKTADKCDPSIEALFRRALRMNDLLRIADTADVRNWRLSELESAWKFVCKFSEDLSMLEPVSAQSFQHRYETWYAEVDALLDEKLSYKHLHSIQVVFSQRLLANRYLSDELYDRLNELSPHQPEQLYQATIPATIVNFLNETQVELARETEAILANSNVVLPCTKYARARAAWLEINYNLRPSTALRCAAATMLVFRMLQAHHASSKCTIDKKITSEHTLDGLLEKLKCIVQRLPDTMESIIHAATLSADSLVPSTCHLSHMIYPTETKNEVTTSTSVIATHDHASEPTEMNAEAFLNEFIAVTDQSQDFQSVKRQSLVLQQPDLAKALCACQKQLLCWLYETKSIHTALWQMDPVVLERLASVDHQFLYLYLDNLLEHTYTCLNQLRSEQALQQTRLPSAHAIELKSFDTSALDPITVAVREHIWRDDVHPTVVATRDQWCCLLAKSTEIQTRIQDYITPLCTDMTMQVHQQAPVSDSNIRQIRIAQDKMTIYKQIPSAYWKHYMMAVGLNIE